MSLHALESDASNAEFIRLYQSIEFPGRALLQAEEQHRRHVGGVPAQHRSLPRLKHALAEEEHVLLHSFARSVGVSFECLGIPHVVGSTCQKKQESSNGN